MGLQQKLVRSTFRDRAVLRPADYPLFGWPIAPIQELHCGGPLESTNVLERRMIPRPFFENSPQGTTPGAPFKSGFPSLSETTRWRLVGSPRANYPYFVFLGPIILQEANGACFAVNIHICLGLKHHRSFHVSWECGSEGGSVFRRKRVIGSRDKRKESKKALREMPRVCRSPVGHR